MENFSLNDRHSTKVQITLPANWAGKKVRLAFDFDSGDDFGNDYQGIMIDNVKVQRSCK